MIGKCQGMACHFFSVGFFLFLIGCGSVLENLDNHTFLSESCMISDDQRDSFLSPRTIFPLMFYLSDEFSKQQKNSIFQSIDEWVDQGLSRDPSTVYSVYEGKNYQLNHLINPGKVVEITPIYSEEIWRSMGYNSSIRGITERFISKENKGYRVYIFIENELSIEQFEERIKHEIGHVLGLGHSCKSSDEEKLGGISCSSLYKDHPYRLAIMFPYIKFSEERNSDSPLHDVDSPYFRRKTSRTNKDESLNTQTRHPLSSLQPNDIVRANCLIID